MFSQQTAETANSLLGAFYLTQVAQLENFGLVEECISTPLLQAFQGRQALYFVNQTLSQLGQVSLGSSWKRGVQLLPPFMALLAGKLPGGRFQQVAKVLYENTGLLFRLASLTSQVALVYFTGSAAAIVTVAYLTLDALDEKGLLPQLASKAYASAKFPLFLTSQFFSAGSWVKAYAWGTSAIVWTTVSYLVPLLSDKAYEKISVAPLKQSLTPQIFQSIRETDTPSKILQSRLNYLGENPLPVRPTINFEQAFLEQWDQLLLKKEHNICRGHDPIQLRSALSQKLIALKKEWAFSEIGIYKLRVVADSLLKKTAEEQAEFLVEFATTNVPPQAIHREFDRCVDQNSVRTLVLQQLQIQRTIRFFKKPDNGTVFFQRIGGPAAGVNLLSLIQRSSDGLIPFGYLGPILPDILLKPSLKKIKSYFPMDLVKDVRKIPNFGEAATRWWKEFIRNQPASTQARFLQEIAATQNKKSLSLQELEELQKLDINDDVVLPMLFEMGILELIPPAIEK